MRTVRAVARATATVAVATGALLGAGPGTGAGAAPAVAGWSRPTTLATVGIFSRGPVVAVSADGTRALAVWFANGPGDPVVRAATATLTRGRAEWSEPLTVSAPSDIRPLDDPVVRMSDDGRRAAVAWSRSEGTGLRTIELATGRWGSGAITWGDPQTLSAPGHDASSPSLGMAADGSRLLLAWLDRSAGVAIVARTAVATPEGLRWTSATTLSASTRCRRLQPQAGLAAADGGTVAVTWEERCGDRHAAMIATGTWPSAGDAAWTPATDLSASSSESRDPQLGVGAGGTVLVAWRQRSEQGKRAVVACLGAVSSDGTSWQREQQVSNPRAGSDDPALAVSADGRVAVAAWKQGGLHRGYAWATTARIVSGAATWQRPRQVSRPDEWTFHPSVAVSDDGRHVGATWYQGGPGAGQVIRYVSGLVGPRTSWSDPVALSKPGRSAFLPAIDVSASGATVIVAWSRDSAEDKYAVDVQVATR